MGFTGIQAALDGEGWGKPIAGRAVGPLFLSA